jgi:hypothetical protein
MNKNIRLLFFIGILYSFTLSLKASVVTLPKTISIEFRSYANSLYKHLNDKDLSFNAFQTGLKGFLKLQSENKIKNEQFITIIDMSMSANKNRFFLIDLKNEKVVYKSKVAHGRNSGGEYAKLFSNKIGSFKSSIGFYKTAETYRGKHGLSLRLDGLEFSNNNARKRAIVIHAADYVSEVFIDKNGRLGRSLGCPSLPVENYTKIIDRIKNGSVLFIYYPNKEYLQTSKLANVDFKN